MLLVLIFEYKEWAVWTRKAGKGQSYERFEDLEIGFGMKADKPGVIP